MDDHTPMRMTLADLLEHIGHEVVAAAGGHEALAHQREKPAEILVTDIFMPDMDGFELIQKFQRLYPKVKIVALSGGMPKNPGPPYLDIAQKFGAGWILNKPFSAQELKDVIAAAVKQPVA